MSLSLIAALAFSTSAQAAAELATTVTQPAGNEVYVEGTWQFRVANTGNRDTSGNIILTIQLPVTHTSPTVHVMGDLGDLGGCSQSGTQLSCNLGKIRKNRSAYAYVDIALPWSASALVVSASVPTQSGESVTSNNSDSETASLLYVDTPITGPVDMDNQHCTGTGLTAWFECSLYPSSISSHPVTFVDDGTIDFSLLGPEASGYSGEWGQDSDDQLWFTYSYAGEVVMEFEGNGVDGACFEGLTRFFDSPGVYSPYVSPYLVCPL